MTNNIVVSRLENLLFAIDDVTEIDSKKPEEKAKVQKVRTFLELLDPNNYPLRTTWQVFCGDAEDHKRLIAECKEDSHFVSMGTVGVRMVTVPRHNVIDCQLYTDEDGEVTTVRQAMRGEAKGLIHLIETLF